MRLIVLFLPLFVAGCAVNAANEGDEPKAVVGSFEQIDGTQSLRAHLQPVPERGVRGSLEEYSSSGPSWSPGATNVLFYDLEAREGAWLFPEGERQIVGEEVLRDSARVRAFLYVIAEEDTNGDDVFDGADSLTIAVSDPEGRRLVRLVEGVTRHRQTIRVDDDTALVLFDAGGDVGALEVDLDSLEAGPQVAMPAPPRAES